MKNIFISLLAVAALASCTKSEIQYEQPEEIALAPIASNVTKSVAGYTDAGVFDGVFPTSIDLYVFANAQDENASGVLQSSWTSPYFSNALFSWQSGGNVGSVENNGAPNNTTATAGAYAGNPTRYWPNVKSLKFAGVSKACNVNDGTDDAAEPTIAEGNESTMTITIDAYTQDNTKVAEGANDLMWFPITEAYNKRENEIPAHMKHACSWITINIYGDDVTATYSTTVDGNTVTNTGWTLNSLNVKSLVHTASVDCGTTAEWTIADNATTSDETYYNGDTTFTKATANYESTTNNFIVIPQTPTSLDVKYTYTSDAANNLTLTETKNVPLTFGKAQDGTTDLKWLPGYHYIYNVKITATEILIDPVVVGWTNYSGNNIDKEVE